MASNKDMPGYLLRRAHQISVAVCTEELLEFGITPPQMTVLMSVHENPGIDITTLSARVSFDRSTLGGILDRLEEKGLIFRQVVVADKRMRMMYATQEGEETVKRTAEASSRAENRILEPLAAAERLQLKHLLSKLIRLQANNVPASVRTVMERTHN